VSLVTRCICKIVITRMSGLLLIPLWKSARFRTFAFPVGMHLASMFSSLKLVCVSTFNWDTLSKDVIGNKSITFLVLGRQQHCFPSLIGPVYAISRWHYTLSSFISYPVFSSRSFRPLIHFVPGHFVSGHFVPWSFRPLVISSPRAECTEVHA
jgi:hypothetical protein